MLIGQVVGWQLSNDISSPTHLADLKEELKVHTNKLSKSDKDALISAMNNLLQTIKELK